MSNKDKNYKLKMILTAVLFLIITIGAITGFMAFVYGTSFETWFWMFLSLLIAAVVIICIMGYK